MTDKEIPAQIEPAIDPDEPTTAERHSYYLLQEPKSPSVAPPNALRVVQYARRQFLHDDPDDFRRPYGFVEYERELTFKEIAEYNLLPFDRDDILLFDLWQSFGQDKAKMQSFFIQYFKVTKGDVEGERMKLASKLITGEWSLGKVKAAIKAIQ